MENFQLHLDKIGEVGYVEQVFHSIAYVSGLPGIHDHEIVVFDDGAIGQAFSIGKDLIEILLFAVSGAKVGSRVARTGEILKVPVGEGLLGRALDPLGRARDGGSPLKETTMVPVDKSPPKIMERKKIEKPLETGVTVVDLIVPLAKGQRELIIGDLKVGKREFLLQAMSTQAKLGTICIYAGVGQKEMDILKVSEFFETQNVKMKTIVIASSLLDAPGLIYLTPYTAMTVAEYFRDKGLDVVLVLDNLTNHARVYREISLLAKRFPGRSSYPGDIFYVHSRIMERAGCFKKGSITCLSVARSVLRDFSGYIQTNLMSMTDGHLFFDMDLYNEGKRPPINPFLSVTRVGHQTQTALLRNVSRELTKFLVGYERMKEFMHFGAEAVQTVKDTLSLGSKIDIFLNQTGFITIPININLIILASLWAGMWNDLDGTSLKSELNKVVAAYETNTAYKKKIDEVINKTNTLNDLINSVKRRDDLIWRTQKT